MTHYHTAVLIGFLLHLLQKYIITPGWTPASLLRNEWRYVLTSLVLTALLAFYGPELLGFITSTMGLGGELEAALKGSPHLFGTLIGLSGGSLAYNLPLIGPVIKDLFKGKAQQ